MVYYYMRSPSHSERLTDIAFALVRERLNARSVRFELRSFETVCSIVLLVRCHLQDDERCAAIQWLKMKKIKAQHC